MADVKLELSVAQKNGRGPYTIQIGVRGECLGGGWRSFESWARCGSATDENKKRAQMLLDAYNNAPALAAEVSRLRKALPDPAKLDVLANLFDKVDAMAVAEGLGIQASGVQEDLRRWATRARAALATEQPMTQEKQ